MLTLTLKCAYYRTGWVIRSYLTGNIPFRVFMGHHERLYIYVVLACAQRKLSRIFCRKKYIYILPLHILQPLWKIQNRESNKNASCSNSSIVDSSRRCDHFSSVLFHCVWSSSRGQSGIICGCEIVYEEC